MNIRDRDEAAIHCFVPPATLLLNASPDILHKLLKNIFSGIGVPDDFVSDVACSSFLRALSLVNRMIFITRAPSRSAPEKLGDPGAIDERERYLLDKSNKDAKRFLSVAIPAIPN